MEVLVDRGVGIDVHKKSVTVCVMTTDGRKAVQTLERFSTFHRGLMEMRDALAQMGVTHVAMDAAWLARLLRHGLLRASFIPAPPIRDLRDLTRMRRKTIEMSARVENRVQKVLEACGIKIGSVVSDLFGATGRAILHELAAHRTGPAALAELAKGKLKGKKPELLLSLEGAFSLHDATLLKHQLDLHAQLDERRAKIQKQLVTMSEPYAGWISRLDEIPGINWDAAIEILGEIGHERSARAERV